MEIRKRLSTRFTLIVALILIASEGAIFIAATLSWRDDFVNRLYRKAIMVARLVADVEGVDTVSLKLVAKNDLSIPDEEGIMICNISGKRIFATRDSGRLRVDQALISKIKTNKIVRVRQGSHYQVGFIYSGQSGKMIVIAGANDATGYKKLGLLRNILIIVFIVALCIAYFCGLIFSDRAIRPIHDVIIEVNSIDAKNLNRRVKEGGKDDEITQLARTFNKMLERLEKAFKSERHFISTVSHDLRTPLSYIMGRLEVTVSRERSNEEYREEINEVLKDMRSLSQSTSKLLLYAQSSSGYVEPNFHPLRVDEVLWDARADLLKINQDYQIRVIFKGDEEDTESLNVNGHRQLLRSAFLNLMENGCKYSEDHTVVVYLQRTGNIIHITFSDQGTGIPEDEQERIFEPFFRSKNTHGKEGYGIGLALVKQVVRIHKGTLTLRSEPGIGSDFTVTLPCLDPVLVN